MSKEFYKKLQFDADINFKLKNDEFNKKLEELGIKQFITQRDKKGKEIKIGMSEEVKKTLKDKILARQEVDDLDKKIRGLKDLGLNKEAKKLEKQKDKLEVKAGFKDSKLKQGMKKSLGDLKKNLFNVLKSVKDFFVNMFKDALEDLKKKAKLDSNSKFASYSDYEEKMEYGFSDGEYYAFKQLQDQYGISKEAYDMGGLNSEQAQLISEKMEFFKKQYEEQKASGYFENIQKMQERMLEFKNILREKIQKFIVEHGTQIIEVLTKLMDVGIKIMEGLFKFFSFFSDVEQSGYQAQKNIDNIINQNMTNSRVNNVNINNTMNASHTGITNKQQLTQATNINYRQLKGALS